jgi:hypothetical protein
MGLYQQSRTEMLSPSFFYLENYPVPHVTPKTGYDTPSRFIAEVSYKNYMIPGFYKSSREDEDTEEK